MKRETAHLLRADLRAPALQRIEVVEPPGRRFYCNNFDALLVGLALKRGTDMSVATYLARKLWRPLVIEADGSWCPDSRAQRL